MVQQLFRFVIQKIKMVFSGVQRLFAPQAILGKFKTAVKRVLGKIFRIRPKDESDYYSVGRLLVSKRLISMIIFVIGIISVYYLVFVQSSFFSSAGNDVKTYNYDSIRLRFANDTVKIKTGSGYIGYYGEVSKGKANGKGIVYSADDVIRYEGELKDSEYNGIGKLYGDNSNLLYSGEFVHNVYQGEGISYRENGSMEYEGTFDNGVKAGKGKLYDSSNNAVYIGNFVNDEINYNELLGKSTAEISEIYTGSRIIYYKDSEFVVNMADIGAYYYGNSDETYLDDSVMVNEILLKNNSCIINGKKVSTISEIQKLLGDVGFEGNSYIKLKEAVVLDKAAIKEGSIKDALEIDKFDNNQELYLTMFECDDIQYTFYNTEKSDEFIMYSIEK